MPEGNEIYKFLKDNNLTDLSEPDFENKYSDKAKASELFSFFKKNELTDLDDTGFYDKYFKKKVSTIHPTGQSFGLPAETSLKPVPPTVSDPPSTGKIKSEPVRSLADFNKKYKVNRTPEQMEGKEPIPIEPQDEGFGAELYESAKRGSARLGSMLANTPSMIYDIAALPQNLIQKYTGVNVGTSAAQFAEQAGLPENEVANYYDGIVKESQAKIEQKYDKGISDYFSNGDYEKGFKLLASQVVESAPISISLMLGNAAGLTTAQSILGGGVVFAADKKKELDANPNMDEAEKTAAALSTGLVEGMFAQFGITKLGGMVSDILKKEGKEKAIELAKKGFIEAYGPIMKKYIGIGAEESLSEAATQFAQNAIDKYSGNNPDLDLRDGVVDAAIVGLGAGSSFSAAPATAEVFTAKKNRAEAVKLFEEKNAIEADIQNPEVSPEVKSILSQKAQEINEKSADLYKQDQEETANLTPEAKETITDLHSQVDAIEAGLQSETLSEAGKQALEAQKKTIDGQIKELVAGKQMYQGSDFISETGLQPGFYTPEEVEKASQSLLKSDKLGEEKPMYLVKFFEDKGTEELTERQIGSVEKAISQGIEAGKSAEEIIGILNALRFTTPNVGGTGIIENLREYLNDRIAGKDKRTYQERIGQKSEDENTGTGVAGINSGTPRMEEAPALPESKGVDKAQPEAPTKGENELRVSVPAVEQEVESEAAEQDEIKSNTKAAEAKDLEESILRNRAKKPKRKVLPNVDNAAFSLFEKDSDESYSYQGERFERKKDLYKDADGNVWYETTQNPEQQQVSALVGSLFTSTAEVRPIKVSKKLIGDPHVTYGSKSIYANLKKADKKEFLADRFLVEKLLGDSDRDNPSNTAKTDEGYGFFDFGNADFTDTSISGIGLSGDHMGSFLNPILSKTKESVREFIERLHERNYRDLDKTIEHFKQIEFGQAGIKQYFKAQEKNGVSEADAKKILLDKLTDFKAKLNGSEFAKKLESETVGNHFLESKDISAADIIEVYNERTDQLIDYLENGENLPKSLDDLIKTVTKAHLKWQRRMLGIKAKVSEVKPESESTGKPEAQTPVNPSKSSSLETEQPVTDKDVSSEQADPKTAKHDNLVSLTGRYNKLSKAKKQAKGGVALLQRIHAIAGSLEYTVKEGKTWLEPLLVTNEKGSKISRTPIIDEVPEPSQEDIDYANLLISTGAISGTLDIGLQPKEILDAKADLEKGKMTKPVKRLIHALAKTKDEEGLTYKESDTAMGNKTVRYFVPFDKILLPSIEETANLTPEEESALAEEYDNFLSQLNPEQEEQLNTLFNEEGTNQEGESNQDAGNKEGTNSNSELTPTELTAAKDQAVSEGFTSLTHKINSINKANGTEYVNIQDTPADLVDKAVTKKKEGETEDAISERITKTEVPPVSETGENKPLNIEGVGEGEQGADAAGEGKKQTRKEEINEKRKTKETGEEVTEPSEDGGQNPPSSKKEEEPEPPKGKKLKLAKRVLESDEVSDDIKEGLKELGTAYIPEQLEIRKAEAKAYVESFEENDLLDDAMANVMDTNNSMKGIVRGAIGAEVFNAYIKQAREATTIESKRDYDEKAARVASFSAVQFKNAGQEINAAKIWKEILSKTPEGAILQLTNEYKERNEPIIATDLTELRAAKRELQQLLETEEGQQEIATRIEKEIEKRAEAIFGKIQKEKISTFFDSLLVDTKGKAFDATLGLPVAVWNGAVKVVKEAVLLGASAANAIKSGIDYIEKNYTGAWKEKEFELLMQTGLKKLNPKRKVELSEKNKNKILDSWEKRLKKLKPDSRKKLLANSIEELNKAGALSEERFKDLYAEVLGLPSVTEEVKSNIFNLIDRINKAETAADAYKKAFDEETPPAEKAKAKSEWQRAVRDARKANEELSDYFRREKSGWETMSTILQGNLLTPISLITNVWSNAVLQPLRFLSGGVANLADYTLSQGAKYTFLSKYLDKERTIDLVTRSGGAWRGLIPGIKEGWKDLKQGLTSDELNQRDLSTKLQPLKAAGELWANYFGDKKLNGKQQVNAFVEATFGMPAEAFFRLLNLGDKPFRRMAEMGKSYEIIKQKGLKGKEAEIFLEFPDEISAEEIKRAGDEATFQGENIVADIISRETDRIKKIPVIGGALGFLIKTVIPYVKTPTNIIAETLDYAVPIYSLSKSAYHATKGNRKESLELFGKAVVGGIISSVAIELISRGLITGSLDDDEPKEKSIQYENVPPNSINITAIGRGLSGQGFDIKDDDIWIKWDKTGVFGSIIGVHANRLKEKGADGSDYISSVLGVIPFVLKTSIEQSFLHGANAVVNALAKGGREADKLLVQMVNTISSVFYPNTVSVISKASDTNIRSIKDETVWKEIGNMFKQKMFMGNKLPSRVTLWGEKVSNAPDERSKWAYGLFDVTKYKAVDTENFGYKIYEQWKKSRDTEWLPSIPKAEISVAGNKIKLSQTEYEQFQILVGSERKRLTKAYVESAQWNTDSEETRKTVLGILYDAGRATGVYVLVNSTPELAKR